MATPRLQKTLADYVAIAIGPVLIMLLVGSLVFFLAEVIARDAAAGTFRWILFWYVFATVLISRIGIEQGKSHAMMYGLVLGGAVALVAMKLLPPSVSWAALLLLGLVWWATSKLVWDCTLIDDGEDASGQGLLQSTGLQTEDSTAGTTESPALDDDDGEETESSTAEHETVQPHHQKAWYERLNSETSSNEERKKAKKPHAPGTWVIYFSLAALPLFGLGQLMIPAESEASRSFAFRLLWLYVAAGLALLVTTSFLGLRRYLRQRKLKMPASVTTAWLTTGGVLIVAVMLICLLIPRPQGDYSLTWLADKLSTKVQAASDNAFVKGEAGEGDGKRQGDRDDDEMDKGQGGGNAGKENEKGGGGGKSKAGGQGDGKAKSGSGKQKGKGQAGKGNQNNENAKTGANNGNRNEQKPQNGNGDQKSGKPDGEKQDARNGRNGRSDNRSNQQNNSSKGSSAPSLSWIGPTVKWILYALIAAIALFIAFKYRSQIAAGFAQFLADLKSLFAGLFGRKKDEKKPSELAEGNEFPKPKPRPFATFANPFETGSADQMSTETVIAYTFEAMEAWAYERDVERQPDQTPLEFAAEVGDAAPEFSEESRRLAVLYTRAAYSENPPTDECRDDLRDAWHAMNTAPPPRAAHSAEQLTTV